MPRIVDLSNNNATDPGASLDVFARALRDGGYVGCYHKASEGATFRDPLYHLRAAQCYEYRVPFGAYHYARPSGGDAIAEADFFCDTICLLYSGDLRPALDLEWTALPKKETVEWSRAFNHRVRKELGVWPLFYSYPAFIGNLHPEDPIGGGLWIASYGSNDGTLHPPVIPAPWRRYVLHQFTSRGRLAGIAGDVDLSWCARVAPLLIP